MQMRAMEPAVSAHVLPASHMGLKSSAYGLQQFTQSVECAVCGIQGMGTSVGVA